MPSLPSFSGKSFKKKRNQIASKSEIDLTTALPSADDFRTSLLMPNLSARFSMLREQDDPTTKIGKANDDSVLFPRRASRLNLFAHNPLTDIAEVSSLSGSARPSLNLGRTSYASGEGSQEDESSRGVLNRPRPVEGNNLFGGRQKIYKIPVRTTPTVSNRNSDEAESNGNMSGRAMYENDMPLSAFQRLRERDREELNRDRGEFGQDAKRIEEEIMSRLPADPTPSSTNISKSLINTPEQPSASSMPVKPGFTGLERNLTKTRRLYGQGLELQGQQTLALDRIESLSRKPKVTDAAQLAQSLSKAIHSEKHPRFGPGYAPSNFRPNSPPLSASSVSGNELSKKAGPLTSAGPSQGYGLAPLSPPLSESGEVSPLAAALQPEDRGKATATGLFNKPHTQYDENQFQQRQVQMFETRTTSPFRRPSPSTPTSLPDKDGRPRGQSTTSYRSRAESTASKYHGGQNEGTSQQGASPPPFTQGTFLAGLSDSEPDSDIEGVISRKVTTSTQVSDSTHTSLRNSAESTDSVINGQQKSYSSHSELKRSESRDLKTISEVEAMEISLSPVTEKFSEKPRDSLTLGPAEAGGLSGLIRRHLRHDSDKSSIYPPPSPGLPPSAIDHHRVLNSSLQATRASGHAASIHSNPWELDEWSKSSQTSEKPSYSPPRPSQQPDQQQQQQQPVGFSNMSLRAKQLLDQANALSGQGQSADAAGKESPARPFPPPPPIPSTPSWQEELQRGHRRGGSSETQVEREELAYELAERRRKVQEKLKSFVETEGSRSSSPTPGGFRDNGSARPGNAFAILKNKTNRANTTYDVPQPKPLKVLGMESAAHNASAPNLASNNELWRDEEERMLREMGRQPRTSSPHVSARHARSRPRHGTPRRSEDETRDTFRDKPSSSWRHPRDVRDRSTSDASGRSKSRPGHREDLVHFNKAPESPQPRPIADETKSIRGPPSGSSSTRPSVETERHPADRTNSAMGGRFRSNSRPAPPNFSIPNPVQTSPPLNLGASPRPSPITPYSANATPPLYETSPVNSSLPTPTTFGGAPSMAQANQLNQSLAGHKRYIDKSQISEPKFVSTTSNVPTVGLPPGASLSNGSSTPPVPPMNPRRRRPTATQTFLGAFKVSDKAHSTSGSLSGKSPEEQSTFSDEDKRSRPRQRLRKISSEGGNLNAKARQQAMMAKSPAVPQVPTPAGPPVPLEGGMF